MRSQSTTAVQLTFVIPQPCDGLNIQSPRLRCTPAAEGCHD
ncbi:hypothetical protein [Lysobacter gummosus]